MIDLLLVFFVPVFGGVDDRTVFRIFQDDVTPQGLAVIESLPRRMAVELDILLYKSSPAYAEAIGVLKRNSAFCSGKLRS